MIASRLLSILMRLQLGPVSARRLASDLEVSTRTIYRDVDELSAAGIPIYCERGRNGGLRLLKDWTVQTPGFTLSDVNALLTAHDPEILKDIGLNLPLSDAQLKLLLALPSEVDRSAVLTSQRLLIDPVQWYRRRDRSEALTICAKAIWDNREITLGYRSWKQDVERTVQPLGLVLKAGVWYLVARTGGNTRTYRVDNILSAKISETLFERPADFDLARVWRESVRRFEDDLKVMEAELELTNEGLRRLDRMGAHVMEAAAQSRRPATQPDWYNVNIPIESIENAVYEILALGRHARVIKPAQLRTKIAKELDVMLSHSAFD